MIKKRQTAAKKKILAMFDTQQHALSHDMMEEILQGEMDRVTIYRILKSFEEDGLVHKIIGEGNKAFYAKCHSCTSHHTHNHLHFQCKKCQKVECIHHEVVVPIPTGYLVDNLQLIANGTCLSCISAQT